MERRGRSGGGVRNAAPGRAAAASSGAVALFHAIGITPEAPTLTDAFGARAPDATIGIRPADITRALAQLSTVPDGTAITAVCLGTPLVSRDQWDRLLPLLREVARRGGVPIYVNTGRDTLRLLEQQDALTDAARFDLRVVTDTCTHLTPIRVTG